MTIFCKNYGTDGAKSRAELNIRITQMNSDPYRSECGSATLALINIYNDQPGRPSTIPPHLNSLKDFPQVAINNILVQYVHLDDFSVIFSKSWKNFFFKFAELFLHL